MTCHDFENAWMTRLDQRGRFEPASDEARLHAASCSNCREVEARYLALERALGGIAPVPAPTPLETERLAANLTRIAQADRLSSLRLRWGGVGILAAASVLAVLLSLPRSTPPRDLEPLPELASASELPTALADARSATIELAWGASAPAARFGAAVLESATATSSTSIPPIAVSIPESSGVIGSMGRQVNEGVKPLRGSALKAFDFLIAPASGIPAGGNPGRGA